MSALYVAHKNCTNAVITQTSSYVFLQYTGTFLTGAPQLLYAIDPSLNDIIILPQV